MAVLLFKKSRSAANIHCGKTWNWKSQCWEFCGCLHMPLTKIQGTLSFNSLKWLLENTSNYRLWDVMQANRHNLKFNCLAAQYKKSETSASRRSLADSQRWKLLCGGPWPQIKFLIPFWLKMTFLNTSSANPWTSNWNLSSHSSHETFTVLLLYINSNSADTNSIISASFTKLNNTLILA